MTTPNARHLDHDELAEWLKDLATLKPLNWSDILFSKAAKIQQALSARSEPSASPATRGESPDEWYEREKTAFRAWWESEGEKTFSRTPTLAAGAGWFARAEAAPETAPIVPCLATNGCATPEWCARNGDACRVKTSVSEIAPTPAYVDAHLDNVLRASGSALKNYTTAKTLDAMRASMRNAVCAPSAIPRIDLSSYVNSADISAADVPHVVVEKLQRAIDFRQDLTTAIASRGTRGGWQ